MFGVECSERTVLSCQFVYVGDVSGDTSPDDGRSISTE